MSNKQIRAEAMRELQRLSQEMQPDPVRLVELDESQYNYEVFFTCPVCKDSFCQSSGMGERDGYFICKCGRRWWVETFVKYIEKL